MMHDLKICIFLDFILSMSKIEIQKFVTAYINKSASYEAADATNDCFGAKLVENTRFSWEILTSECQSIAA